MSALPILAFTAATAPPAGASGAIQGTVFQESVTFNGTQDAGESGVSGVTVSAFDASNTAQGTATTLANGTYTLNATGTGPYRLEFTGAPAPLQSSSVGANGSSVRFVADGASTGNNWALMNPSDYCQTTPQLATSCFRRGQYNDATNNTLNQISSFPYDAAENTDIGGWGSGQPTVTKTSLATTGQVGATYGMAYQRSSKTIFASAYTKRHSSYGPSGAGAIYKITNAGTPALLIDLNAAVAPANSAAGGPFTRNGASPNDWRHDADVFDDVMKSGIGDIDVSDDDKTLYAMALADKKLYAIPLVNSGGAVTAGTPVGFATPTPAGCPATDSRPFAVSTKGATVYVGVTCTAQSTQNTANLNAYVYSFNGATFNATPVITVPLNYPRLCGDRSGVAVWPGTTCSPGGTAAPAADDADWHPWTDTFDPNHHGSSGTGTPTPPNCNPAANPNTGCGFGGFPQPVLSDMVWDGNNLVLAFRDRYGDQIGFNDGPNNATASLDYNFRAFTSGDMLRACPATGTTTPLILESNGTCGGVSTTGNTANYDPEGPGNGEFYFDDRRQLHDETSNGSVAQIPGRTEFATSQVDPTVSSNDGGVGFFSHTNGTRLRSTRLYDTDGIANAANTNTFAKANGIGDIEVMCDMAPIQLGNRVWNDTNGNGRQDAGETGIANATVTLFEGATSVGSTTTNASGEYYFGGLANGGAVANAGTGTTGVQAFTAYSIRLNLAANYNNGGVLDGKGITTANAAGVSDLIDSDATASSTTDNRIAVTTGAAGATDHTQDFGFVNGSIGDRVWFDQDGDGVQDAGEPGIPGITVTLLWAGPNGVIGTGADDVTTTTTTDASGNYLFSNLQVGQGDNHGVYRVTVTPPAGMTNTGDPDTASPGDSISNAVSGAGQLLTTAPNNLNQDFGYRGTGSIGDRIFFDANNNGVDNGNGTDPGIPGVTVTLLWFGNDGVAGGTDDLTLTTTTGANGAYQFTNLPAGATSATGRYRVTVTPPAGMTNTVDPDTANPGNSVSNAIQGANGLTAAAPNNLNQDFGYAGTGSVGDRVWYDTDGDGVQDAGEPGIQGVTVTLLWLGLDGVAGTSDDLTFTTTTSSTGAYLFSNLPVGATTGQYRVTVTAPAGMTNTGDPDTASPGNSVSNAVQGAGALTAAAPSNLNQDFGYRSTTTGTIGDQIFWDKNGNGSFDTGEGLNGVTVTLVWGGANGVVGTGGDDVTFTTTTNSTGFYQFTGLPAGAYTVTVTSGVPSYLTVNTVDPDTASPGNSTSSLTLASGGTNNAQDFGYRGTGSIGDRVFIDANNNGVDNTNATDPGIVGATVTLLWFGPDGVEGGGDDQTFTTTTGAAGAYLFSGLPTTASATTGRYRVTVSGVPAGMVNNIDPDTANPGNSISNAVQGASGLTTAAPNNLNQDFGYRDSGSIGDQIFWDKNGNGSFDSGEGLNGVTVTVTWLGLNGTAGGGDDVTYTATTNSTGFYQVTNLPAGNYTVAVGAGVPSYLNVNTVDPDTASPGNSASALTLTSGQSNQAQDFGYRGSGSIGDRIFYDANNNGVDNTNAVDPGLVGVTVTLLWFGPDGTVSTADDQTFTTTTGAAGAYLFSGLPVGATGSSLEGRYRVTVSGFPTGATNVVDPDTANPGNNVSNAVQGTNGLSVASPANLNQDFGYFASGVIGDQIFWDKNGNGTFDAGEGLNGVTVTVVWLGANGTAGGGDDITYTATTNSTGFYQVTGLPAGNYTVTVGAGVPSYLNVNTVDPDTANPGNSTSSLTLANGGTNTAQDFGYRGSGSIGDRVFYDTAGNGVDNTNATDPGLPGLTVTLLWFGPDGIAGNADDVTSTTTTGAAGAYSFTGLPVGATAGQYRVTVSGFPTGATNTVDPDGGANSISNAVQGAGALTAASPSNQNQDFGYHDSGSIGDQVFWDKNGNGSFDAGEGISGATVTVTYLGKDGVAGGGDDIVSTRTTTSTGFYQVNDLPAGNYTVAVSGVPAYLNVNTVDPDTANPGNSASALTLTSGQSNQAQDFGYRGSGSIGDRVFYDTAGNAVDNTNATDPGLVGLTVTLLWFGPDGVAGNGDDQTFTTTTGAAGAYLFSGLPVGATGSSAEGRYRVTVSGFPTGATNTVDPDTANPGNSVSNAVQGSNGLSVASPANLNQDFGYFASGAIGDRIFWDKNANGSFDLGEGLGGVTVTVVYLGANGVAGGGDDLTYTTTTNSAGLYTVSNLPAGNYTVTVGAGVPAYLPTNSVDPDTANPGNQTSSLTLANGQFNDLQDFGYVSNGSIGDRVFWDADNDGVDDGNALDPGLVGVPVTLLWFGPDGIAGNLDDVTYGTTTTAGGAYLFSALPVGATAGQYRVTVTGPTGATNTVDPDTANPGNSVSNAVSGAGALTTAAPANLNQDFGYSANGSIGDTIFWDKNGNNTFDAGEGLNGVTVNVVWSGPDNNLATTADNVTYAATTAGDGFYQRNNLPFGLYRVDVAAGVPSYLNINSVDPDTANPGNSTSQLTISAGTPSNQAQDFGYVGNGIIGDRVWYDLDGDGVQDAGEPGIPGVTVQLLWFGPDGNAATTGDNVTTTTTTGTNGAYTFTGLAVGATGGQYRVTVTTPVVNATNTGDPDGGANSVSNAVTGAGALTSASPSNLNQDFGYRASSSGQIGDTIFWDQNGNGTPDSGEGLSGVTVNVVWAGLDNVLGTGDDVTFPVTTNASGNYLATQLPDGNYRVDVVSGVPAVLTVNTVDPDTANPGNSTSTLTLGVGGSNLAQDFGYTGSASLGDRVWLDTNGNGIQDSGENGVPGVTVTLAGPQSGTTTTDASGNYAFTGLVAGTYTVTFTQPAGYALTTTNAGGSTAANDSNGLVTSNITLATGASDQTIDLGLITGTIGDRVWVDSDADGIQDAGEVGLAGVTVTLSGAASATTTTDGSGNYVFTGLLAGTYTVTFTQPGGYLVSPTGAAGSTTANDSNGLVSTNIVLAAGGSNPTIDLGVYQLASIGDYVWLDDDADGIQDAGETGVANVTVTLVQGATTIATTTTDGAGAYSFTGLTPGTYDVVFTQPAGYDISPTNAAGSTTANDSNGLTSTVTLTSGQNDSTIDLGLRLGAIGDTIWHDQNGDGAYQAGEGIAGVVVTLTWGGPDNNLATTGDNVVRTATTDAAGHYLFLGLRSGVYQVVVTTTGNAIQTLALSNVIDPDGGNDSRSVVTLAPAEINLVQDFAYRRIANDKMFYADLTGPSCSNTPLNVATPVRLATQQLVIRTFGGCSPAVGSTWDVETAPAITGNFASVTGQLLPNGEVVIVSILPDRVRLTVVNGIAVTTAADLPGLTPGFGCITINLGCSLRAAVQEGNAVGGSNAIILPAGAVFNLTNLGANEDQGIFGDLDVTSDLTIYGPTAATIDGQGGDRVLDVKGSASLSVNGLTIRNGATGGNGGCVSAQGGALAFVDVAFTGCSALNGGAVSNTGGSTTFTRGSVRSSTAAGNGGGVAASGAVFVDTTSFTLNSAGAVGGALYVPSPSSASTLMTVYATIAFNGANKGGGIATGAGTTATVSMTNVSSNTSSADGAGLWLAGATTLDNARVNGNTTNVGTGGGAFVAAGGSLNVFKVTFDTNTAADGGGIASNGPVTLTTSTVSTNTAPVGAALSLKGTATATVADTTITKQVGGTGAAVTAPAGTVTFTNSINSDQTSGPNCSAAQLSGGYNQANDATCGLTGTGDVQTGSANLGALVAGGGFAPTHKANAGSQVINTGAFTCGATDQRGNLRPRGGRCEKGSVES